MFKLIGDLFSALLHFFGNGLSFFYDLIPSYGIAIILLTVAVRLVMLPLTIKQTKSMQEMQKLQPEVKRLQAKYKGGDRQKLNEEMMKLYKEHKVNPLGGCLPLLLQLPIFLALYRVFAGCGKTVSKTSKTCLAGWVGVKYLPQHGALARAINDMHAGFLGMNLGLAPVAALRQVGLVQSLPYYVLVVAMVLTTWYQQKQIQAVSTGQQAQQMQMMGKIMPLLLGVFSLNLPAGVSVYWVASNLWTIGQQRLLLGKTVATPGAAGPAAPAAGAKTTKPVDTPAPKGLSALLRARQEDAPAGTTDAKTAPKPRTQKPGTTQKPGAKPRPKPAVAGSDGQDGQPAKGNGAVKPKPVPADSPIGGEGRDGQPNGKPATAESGGPKPVGASSRPRNSNAKKRRRR